jgi:hypothetical protein
MFPSVILHSTQSINKKDLKHEVLGLELKSDRYRNKKKKINLWINAIICKVK